MHIEVIHGILQKFLRIFLQFFHILNLNHLQQSVPSLWHLIFHLLITLKKTKKTPSIGPNLIAKNNNLHYMLF
jgi:hypothetical protein